MVVVEGRNVVDLTRDLMPGYRIAINAVEGREETFVGGVYRNQTGSWFAYDADVTDGAEDADEAISILLDVLSDFDRATNPDADVHERPVSQWRIYLEAI